MNKILSLFSLVLFISCKPFDTGKVYEDIIAIPSSGWPSSQTYKFDMPVTDTAKAYDLLIHVRNSGRYSYSNIWLFIESVSPKGNSQKDTFEIRLADDLGRWLGKGVGEINNMLVPYKENILFPVKGIYQIRITQGMREETLENILNLGVRLQVHN